MMLKNSLREARAKFSKNNPKIKMSALLTLLETLCEDTIRDKKGRLGCLVFAEFV